MAACFRCGEAPAETGVGTPLCASCWYKKISRRSMGSRRHHAALAALWEAQGGRCVYTGVLLVRGLNASLDHRVPTSRGGGHERENLQWVTQSLNQVKANRTHEEFLALCRTVVQHVDGVESRKP